MLHELSKIFDIILSQRHLLCDVIFKLYNIGLHVFSDLLSFAFYLLENYLKLSKIV